MTVSRILVAIRVLCRMFSDVVAVGNVTSLFRLAVVQVILRETKTPAADKNLVVPDVCAEESALSSNQGNFTSLGASVGKSEFEGSVDRYLYPALARRFEHLHPLTWWDS
jgi:hypothetical protein